MSRYLGIDPGVSGAIAILDVDGDGQIIRCEFHDTPVREVIVAGKHRNLYDLSKMNSILFAANQENHCSAFIEIAQPMPSVKDERSGRIREGMGAVSAFNYGYGYGAWLMGLTANKIPYTCVHPKTWKKQMMRDMGREKSASIFRAVQIYPSIADQLSRVKDHGRADAFLLAVYGSRLLHNSPIAPF